MSNQDIDAKVTISDDTIIVSENKSSLLRNDSISSNSGVTKTQWVSTNAVILHLDNSICRKIVAG